MKIPKSKYNVGDEVIVRCDEYPTIQFQATITGVRWLPDHGHHEYIIADKWGIRWGGYTDEWFFPQPNQPQ